MIKIPSYKNIAVFGLGKAGVSTVRALQNSGVNIFAWDDGVESREKLADVALLPPKEWDWTEIEALVLSPGIPFTHPKPHEVVDMAKAANVPIICDVELLYLADPKAKFVGITGTNGKSTTTALIGHILKEAGVKSAIGGNIGVPVLDLDVVSEDGVYVIEMSSYQLDLIDETKFDISVLLNITPDHLDRHGGMEGYVVAKKHIFDAQGKDDVAIISMDDEYCRKVYDELKDAGIIGQVIPVSVDEKLDDGIAVIDGVIYDGLSDKEIKLGDLKRLPGKHNAQNIAVAYLVAKLNSVNIDEIPKFVGSFGGLAHRMQYVGEKDGVAFINDSKATNAEAASKALATFDNIYWIAGGVAKEGGIDSLKEYFPKIRKAYLIGQAQDEFAEILDGKVEYNKCGELEAAVQAVKKDVDEAGESKGVVLLSPACASFDQWPNFEARGEAFIEEYKSIRV